MALSFSFHHVYLGVIVAFLRGEFKDRLPKDTAYSNWDDAGAHTAAAPFLRFVTVISGALVFASSSWGAFFYGLSQSNAESGLNLPWIEAYGMGASAFAGAIIVIAAIYRQALEAPRTNAKPKEQKPAEKPAQAVKAQEAGRDANEANQDGVSAPK